MSTWTSSPRVRIGDAERDAAAGSLGDHFAAGRLTREEFDERLEQAWSAKTADELTPLFVDLPGERTPARTGRAEGVGFHDHDRRRRVEPSRRPSGRPPVLLVLLVVAIVLTIISSLPFFVVLFGFLWFTGILGHCGRASRRSWASNR